MLIHFDPRSKVRHEKESMDDDYNQMKSQWKTVVQTIREQKERIAVLEKKLSVLSKSEVGSLFSNISLRGP